MVIDSFFFQHSPKDTSLLLLYVDNIIITGNNEEGIHQSKVSSLKQSK